MNTINKTIKSAFLLLIIVFCNLNAQHLFAVNYNDLAPEKIQTLQAQVASNESFARKTPLQKKKNKRNVDVHSLSLASAQNTQIIILNEETGKNVVLTLAEDAPAHFELPPFFIEELRQAVLGDAEQYLMMEASADFSVRNAVSVSSAAVLSLANKKASVPRYFYGKKENVKEALPKDRQIVHIFKHKPRLIPAFPDDPENLREIAQLEEEMSYYVYMYKLPDETLVIYDEHFDVDDNQSVMNSAGSNLQFSISGTMNATQRTALEYALNIWSQELAGTVPVDINVSLVPIAGNTLGRCFHSPNILLNVNGSNTYYLSSLGNQLAGYDFAPTQRDIKIEMNTNYNWHYGTTSNPSSSQLDFVTIMLHEVTHGLGFSSNLIWDGTSANSGRYIYVTRDDGSGYYTDYPGIYDRQLFQGATGSALTSLTQAQRASLMVSNNLYAGRPGSHLLAANNGTRVKMYAPTTYAPGSSVSHWDNSVTFSTFMKYSASNGFKLHTINSRKIALMRDIGWDIPQEAPPATPTVAVGAQNGIIFAGTAGTATFPVTTSNISNGSYSATVANLPSGVTVQGQIIINNNAGTLTLASSETVAVGTYSTLRLTINSTQSAAFTLNVHPADTYVEDFENSSGGTLAGWTIANGTQANKWNVGTATANGAGRSIYIANVTTPSLTANNSYNIASTSTVHFYRDFSVNSTSSNPAKIIFDWKCQGESGFDYLRVYVVETSVTPAAGTLLSNTALVTLSKGGTTWNRQEITLPPMSGNKRLVFTWRNDNSYGDQPPAAIDNIMAINISVRKTVDVGTQNGTIIAGTAGTATFAVTTAGIANGQAGTVQWFSNAAGTMPVTAPTGISASISNVSSNAATVTVAATTAATQGKRYFKVMIDGAESEVQTLDILGPLATFAEDFESGSGGTLAGWTIVNGTNTNKWNVGTATANGTGRSIYITNAALSLTAANNYNVNYASTVHFYQDLVVNSTSANPAKITFDWKSQGEIGYDYLAVYMVETSVTPAAGTLLSSTALVTLSMGGASNWISEEITLPPMSGTKRLVFTWRNNNNQGAQPSAAIDNIAVTNVSLPNSVIAINSHPAPNTNLILGGSSNLSVSASATQNATISYQWYRNTLNSNVGGTAIEGATNAEFIIPTNLIEGTYYYFCEINATGGANTVYSNVATVNVDSFKENFESGSGGTLAGWTIVNGTQTNKWNVGTATANGTGRSIYITNAALSLTAPNAYSTNVASRVHFYRDFHINSTIDYPTTLSFDWQCQGSTVEGSPFHYLTVSIIETSNTPTAGDWPPGAIELAVLNMGGAKQWNTEEIILPQMQGSKRLVFTWNNDANDGEQPPVAIDNIKFTYDPLTTYAVNFSLNGGSGTPPPSIANLVHGSKLGEGQKPDASVFARAGYFNDGDWHTRNNSGIYEKFVFGNDAGTAVTDNTTLYIKWEFVPYTITFNPNGGTVNPTSAATGEGWKLASLPVAIQDGYFFEGWFTAATGGTKITENTVFDAPATVYAQWTPSYTITFEPNGGTVNPTSVTTGSGAKLSSLPRPVRPAHAFRGWFTEATGGVERTTDWVYTEDATLYAQWTFAPYTITFNSNGGMVSPTSGQTNNEAKLAFLPTPTRTGNFIFSGWFTAETGGERVTENTVFNASITIYARWTQIYTITFNPNGGTVSPTSATTGEDQTLASLPTPTRTDWTFNGWFTAATGGTQVTENTVFNANTTIYAQWTHNATFFFETFNENAPSGWTWTGGYDGWFRVLSGGGYNNSPPVRANIYNSAKTAAVTIPNARLGEKAVFSFKYKATNYSGGTAAASNSLAPIAISVSENGGATWSNPATANHVSSVDYRLIYHDLSGYANKTVWIRLTFTQQTGDIYVWLDDITLTGARYTVTFDANGGQVSPAFGTTGGTGYWWDPPESMRSLASLPIPTKQGDVFNSWFTAATGGTQVTVAAEYNANTTIYARWEPSTPVRLPQIAAANQITAIGSGLRLTAATTGAIVRIYDVRGKGVARYSLTSGEHSISLNHLPKGVYIANVVFGNERKTARVVVK